MALMDHSMGATAIGACVVVGGAVIFKQTLSVAFADIAHLINQLCFKVFVAYAGMVPKSVEMRVNGQVVRAHYLERNLRKTSRSRGNSTCQDILVVPGFTAEATFMAQLIPAMNLSPETRVCIMEFPLHGKNVENFDGKTFPKPQQTVDYALAFVEAVGLGKTSETKTPLNLFGYSMGGAICFQMLAQKSPGTYRSAVLLAPALENTMDDDFNALSTKDPRKVHGWETLPECKEFFTTSAGGFYPTKLPYVVLAGVHRQRELTYAPHDRSFFTNFFRRLHGGGFELEPDEAKQKLLRAHRKTPVLVVCGDRDDCISLDKCQRFFGDSDNECFLFRELLDTGHVGGPADRRAMFTILDMAGPIAAEFLFG